MIMNKCIINSTPPSVHSLNIATRRNENIIVSSALFSVSCAAKVKRQKSNTAGHHDTFLRGENLKQGNITTLQSGTHLSNTFVSCTCIHRVMGFFCLFISVFLLLSFLWALNLFAVSLVNCSASEKQGEIITRVTRWHCHNFSLVSFFSVTNLVHGKYHDFSWVCGWTQKQLISV